MSLRAEPVVPWVSKRLFSSVHSFTFSPLDSNAMPVISLLARPSSCVYAYLCIFVHDNDTSEKIDVVTAF